MTWTLARACMLREDFSRAEALLAGIIGAAAAPATLVQRGCWYARAELSLAQGQPGEALATLDRLIEQDRETGAGRFSPYVARLRAEILAALGRTGQAEAALHAIQRSAAEHGARRLLWRAHASLAALYCRQGRHREGEQAASAARALVEELAADVPDADLRDGFRRQVSARLESDPLHPTSGSPNLAGLSAREIEVLRLLAAGLSNAVIAEQLYLSARTVNSHLTSIYAKLGVNSRSAAVRFALDRGLR